MRHVWEVKVGDWMRNFLGDARGARKRFNREVLKSRHLKEIHKHQSRDKKGQYVDFHSEEFWARFHEVRQKAEEEVAATGAALAYDLYWFLEAGYLKPENGQVATGLPPCYLEAAQRIMRRVEAAISSVCAAFDEHMMQFSEQNHLSYTSMPLMMDIVRAAMAVIPSTSLSTTVAAGTSDAVRLRIHCGFFGLK
ncbi:hypothetical protein M9H77_35837 [Catharanthus roseus]|uniref:Uncharacterized protein n=1 Tax=Catharanthus roseus TaxID=4058 RepID=A0ACB9ZUC8_CATRO|nr:hypothetical protein M9H77_35837 [Catharanthus roseus]